MQNPVKVQTCCKCSVLSFLDVDILLIREVVGRFNEMFQAFQYLPMIRNCRGDPYFRICKDTISFPLCFSALIRRPQRVLLGVKIFEDEETCLESATILISNKCAEELQGIWQQELSETRLEEL